MFRSNNSWCFLFGAVIFCLLVFNLIRANELSFTHDEALSYSIIKGDDVYRGKANNHLLNTALMAYSAKAFEESELALRIPNVLAFLVYAVGIFLLSTRLRSIWAKLLLLALAMLNPFLNEFFSLARGYGLALGFMVVSLHFLIRSFERKPGSIWTAPLLSCLFGSLAMWANFSFINFYLLSILLLAGLGIWNIRNRDRKVLLSVGLLVAFCSLSIPLILGVDRLLMMQEYGALYFGEDSLLGTLYSLVDRSAYSEYAPISRWLVGPTCVLFASAGIYFSLRTKADQILMFAMVLLSLMVITPVMQHLFFDVRFPAERTALCYMPVISIAFALILDQALDKWPKTIPVPAVLLITALGLNFILHLNTSKTLLWGYDAHTKEVMLQLEQDRLAQQTFSCHWLFSPSVDYFIRSRKLGLPLTSKQGVDHNSDWIYVLDVDHVEDHEQVLRFDDTKSALLKKMDQGRSIEGHSSSETPE